MEGALVSPRFEGVGVDGSNVGTRVGGGGKVKDGIVGAADWIPMVGRSNWLLPESETGFGVARGQSLAA